MEIDCSKPENYQLRNGCEVCALVEDEASGWISVIYKDVRGKTYVQMNSFNGLLLGRDIETAYDIIEKPKELYIKVTSIELELMELGYTEIYSTYEEADTNNEVQIYKLVKVEK